jgi:hypothetical protein
MSAILVTVTYFAILLFIQHNRFLCADKAPEIQQIDEKTKKLASTVHVGMHINGFPVFSFDRGEFTIDATVWFKFPAATQAISTLEEFTLYNGLIQETGTLLYRSTPIIKLLGEDVLVCYHMQTTFKIRPNHKYFPIGDHTLHILLLNKSATAQELCFTTDTESLLSSENFIFENWFYRGKRTQAGYVKSELHPSNPALEISYPAVLFSIDFENTGGKKVGSLYIPMLIIFLIGLLSLLIMIGDPLQLSLITGAISSLALFRLVIDGTSPNTGYAMHVDMIFYTFMLLLFIILGFQIYVAITLNQIKTLTDVVQKKIKLSLEKMCDAVFISNLVLLMILVTYSFYK